MSRIPAVPAEQMTQAQQAVVQELVSGPHGHVVGPYPAWLQSPELARRARALSEFVRFKSSLPRRLTELAILVTGRHWKAEYEFWAHARLARAAGVEEEIIEAIAARRRPPLSEPHDAAVYDVCSELFETHRLGDATYKRAVEALGLPTVVELVATIGYYSMVSLTLNAFQVALPTGESSPFPD